MQSGNLLHQMLLLLVLFVHDNRLDVALRVTPQHDIVITMFCSHPMHILIEIAAVAQFCPYFQE